MAGPRSRLNKASLVLKPSNLQSHRLLSMPAYIHVHGRQQNQAGRTVRFSSGNKGSHLQHDQKQASLLDRHSSCELLREPVDENQVPGRGGPEFEVDAPFCCLQTFSNQKQEGATFASSTAASLVDLPWHQPSGARCVLHALRSRLKIKGTVWTSSAASS